MMKKYPFYFSGVTALFLTLLVALPVYCYWGALSGPFLFDDFANLDSLSLIDPNLSWHSIDQYLNNRPAGPGGRPVALLSFLLNDFGWPSDARSFKYTNLMLHIINGLLVLLLTFNLLIRKKRFRHTFFVSVAISCFWVLNPYNVSSVMYVVQRMALLSATFVILGLILYLYGRIQLEKGRKKTGFLLIFLGYISGAVIGVLAKENAALFVWLVLPLEYIFFREGKRACLLKLFLWVPALALALAFIYKMPDFLYKYEWVRDFSLVERLLSEGRALLYYMWRYLVPGVDYLGIYADGFQKSTGLFSPLSTFFSLLFHAFLVSAALLSKRRLPFTSFGIIFFYLSHFMEGTVVPLEIIFEHRNYLPSMFLVIGVADINPRQERSLLFFLLSLALVCSVLLKVRADFWGDSLQLKAIFHAQNEHSERAASDYAKFLEDAGAPYEGLKVLRAFSSDGNAGIHLALNQIALACSLGVDDERDEAVLLESPYKYRGKGDAVSSKIKKVSILISSSKCNNLSFDSLRVLMENYSIAYPRDAEARQAALVGAAYIEFYSGSYFGFRNKIYKAISENLNYDLHTSACNQIYHLGQEGDACECLNLDQEHALPKEEWPSWSQACVE